MEKIVIWDHECEADQSDSQIVLWRSYGDDSGKNIVMPSIVEESADEIRQIFLGWIYGLGNKKYHGQTVIQILTTQETFSYWWMSLLVEKSNFSKSPNIDDACKLIAFNKWASAREINELHYSGLNNKLADCFKNWCGQRKIKFKRADSVKVSDDISLNGRIYRRLPYFLQAAIWLGYYIFRRWPLLGAGKLKWMQTPGKLTFVSYFANLVPGALSENRFESFYWNDLISTVAASGTATNWLHIYVPDRIVTSPKKARELIGLLNRENRELQCHVMLDSFLSLKVISHVIRDCLRLRIRARKLESILAEPLQEEIDLWPLFKNDWHQSVYGKTAISNAWHYHLFNEAMNCLPKQESCVYLQENIDWEFAFLYTWKKAGHGRTIGFPHSTIRFWDLRYFFDPRSFTSIQEQQMMPLPDIIAVNGPMAKQFLQAAGYPSSMLKEVESVRYNYLNVLLELFEKKATKHHQTDDEASIQLLVLGDIEIETTRLQMNILRKASPAIKDKVRILVKPHPLCPIQPTDFPDLAFELTATPVDQLLPQADIAFTGAITSAAVDAYLFGIPVISVLDQQRLNLSPLRGRNGGVYFIGNSYEFEKALEEAMKHKPHKREQDIFYLDPLLPRWKKLLGIQG